MLLGPPQDVSCCQLCHSAAPVSFHGLDSFSLPGLCLFGSTLVFIDSRVWQHAPATPQLPKVHMQHSTVT